MNYYILAKIVGPYLPDSYKITSDIEIVKNKFSSERPSYPNIPIKCDDDLENYLKKQGVNHRFVICKDKINTGFFESSYTIKTKIKNDNPHSAKQEGIKRIEQIIESLELSLFSNNKSTTGNFYWYDFVGAYKKSGKHFKKVDLKLSKTGVNFFPKKITNEELSDGFF